MPQWKRIKVPHRPNAPIHESYNELCAEHGNPLMLPVGAVFIWDSTNKALIDYAFNHAKKSGTHLTFDKRQDGLLTQVRVTVAGRWIKI